MAAQGLSYGSLGKHCAHVCVDMQRLFAEPSEWATPWITRVLPRIVSLVERKADQTIFTRFIPAARAGQGVGTWKRYYERWASMTIEAIGPEMVELLSPLPALKWATAACLRLRFRAGRSPRPACVRRCSRPATLSEPSSMPPRPTRAVRWRVPITRNSTSPTERSSRRAAPRPRSRTCSRPPHRLCLRLCRCSARCLGERKRRRLAARPATPSDPRRARAAVAAGREPSRLST